MPSARRCTRCGPRRYGLPASRATRGQRRSACSWRIAAGRGPERPMRRGPRGTGGDGDLVLHPRCQEARLAERRAELLEHGVEPVVHDPVHREARQRRIADHGRRRAAEPAGLEVEALGVAVRPRRRRSSFSEGQRDPRDLVQPAGRRGPHDAVRLELERPLERPHSPGGRGSVDAVLFESLEGQTPLRDPVVEHPLDREDQAAPLAPPRGKPLGQRSGAAPSVIHAPIRPVRERGSRCRGRTWPCWLFLTKRSSGRLVASGSRRGPGLLLPCTSSCTSEAARAAGGGGASP